MNRHAKTTGTQDARIDGRYRVESELGRGGMAAVHRVHDEGLDRVLALKLMSSRDPKQIAMFEREYRTLSQLSHPRLISVHDFGALPDGSARYYTMELLGGQDLVDSAPIPWQRACEHLRDVCTTLALLHARRLLHRDVNPRNVRLDASGRVKLLDFGALASFGSAREVVGAPSCIAPEALRGQPLDGRTDLFSLGVVAYWSLTRTLPFAIERLQDCEAAWERSVLPPSAHVHAISPAVDALILSLLNIDPLGRPPSAAHVLDRLSAITGLDDEANLGLVESHLASAPLVGRASQQATLGPVFTQLAQGTGSVLDVIGQPGAGKTRMLGELRVESQLAGLACLRLEGSRLRERGSLQRALAQGLAELAPGPAPAVESTKWMLALTRERPLLLAIDDAHLLDDGDAELLTALAQGAADHALLIALARPVGRGPLAVQRLGGQTLPMAALNQEAVEQLVDAIFGAAQHRARLAQWLSVTSRGQPARLHALLRELVARQVIRYAGAAWILPSELAEVVVRQPREEPASARELSPLARTLVRLLAVDPGPLLESVLLRVLEHEPARRVHEALSQLVAEQLTELSPAGHRLAHDGLRAELRASFSAEQLTQQHRELARALAAESPRAIDALASARADGLALADVLLGVRVGHHLLEGGDVALGKTLVRHGAIELTLRGDGLSAAAFDLEGAVASLRKHGYGYAAYGAPLAALSLAGMYQDWRLSYRYGEEALEILVETTGLRLASRLRRWLGGTLALYIGLASAFMLFTLLPRRRVAHSFRQLLLALVGITSALLSVCCVVQDRTRARGIGTALAPLRFLPGRHPLRMVHELQLALLAHAEGDYATASEYARRVRTYVRSPAAQQVLPAHARVQLEAGALLLLGHLDPLCTDGRAAETLAAIEQLEGSDAQALVSARAALHGHRGEQEQLAQTLEELDQLAIRSGSIWRNDMSLLRVLWSSYLLCEDVMALKRAMQQLQSLADELPSVARLRNIIDACYLCERGAPADALRRHGALFEQAHGLQGVRALQELGAYARILRKAGRAGEALEVCERALVRIEDKDRPFTVITFALEAERALALSALNDARAVEASDQLLAAQSHDNPMLHGLAHGVRARVALALEDEVVFAGQLAQMERWFYGTRNPALVAQVQRLAERARVRHEDPPTSPGPDDLLDSFETELTDEQS